MQPVVDHSRSFVHPARNVRAIGVQPGMTVADFGAGSGAYVFLLAEAVGPTGTVYAVDVQRDLLRRIRNEAAHRGLKQIEVVWGDVERERGSMLREGIADFVLLSNILFQLSHPKYALEEARRLLKPGGHVAVVDWDDPAPQQPHARVLIGPRKEHVVSRDRAIAVAIEAGLYFTHEFNAGAHHYGLLFQAAHSDL